ncbi:hypothetical protein WN48_01722 [Eufriesea mexicana]|nr:hypothetical protein WN48_01722 [Eufriesea mexicana]
MLPIRDAEISGTDMLHFPGIVSASSKSDRSAVAFARKDAFDYLEASRGNNRALEGCLSLSSEYSLQLVTLVRYYRRNHYYFINTAFTAPVNLTEGLLQLYDVDKIKVDGKIGKEKMNGDCVVWGTAEAGNDATRDFCEKKPKREQRQEFRDDLVAITQ